MLEIPLQIKALYSVHLHSINLIFLFFSFGENKPSHFFEGLHSSHNEIVEIILDSNFNLCSLFLTSLIDNATRVPFFVKW